MMKYFFPTVYLVIGLSLFAPIVIAGPMMEAGGACSVPEMASLDQRLEQITQNLPAAGQEELARMENSIDMTDVDISGGAYVTSRYEGNGNTYIHLRVSEDDWKVIAVQREAERSFHGNDMFRNAFQALRSEHNLPIGLPKTITRSTIVNQMTVGRLIGIDNLAEPAVFSDAFFNETPNGKMTKYMLGDFRLKATRLRVLNGIGEEENLMEIGHSIDISVEPMSEEEESLRLTMEGLSVSN